MIQRRHTGHNATHLGGAEDDGQFDLGIGPDQLHFMRPGAAQGFLPEHFDRAQGLGAGLAGHLPVGLELDELLANLLGADELSRNDAVRNFI